MGGVLTTLGVGGMVGIGILIVVLLIVLWAIRVYNSLIRLRENVRNSRGQIAAQIESRWDLVKNLIDATKQYTQHEKDTFADVTAMRTSLGANNTVAEISESEAQMSQVLGRLIAVAENYPQLRASEVYQTTMEKIDKYENNLRMARMIYNDTVTKYNREMQIFPTSIVAGIFHFTPEEYFQNDAGKTQMPSW